MEDMREDLKLSFLTPDDMNFFQTTETPLHDAATRELKAVVLPVLGYACPFKSYWFSDNTSRLFISQCYSLRRRFWDLSNSGISIQVQSVAGLPTVQVSDKE
ncbi:hypothetical protein Peur_041932 [Populus x canadensis]